MSTSEKRKLLDETSEIMRYATTQSTWNGHTATGLNFLRPVFPLFGEKQKNEFVPINAQLTRIKS